jgi:multidrug efflux pump subunit AcrA (membrane-fusion protein)
MAKKVTKILSKKGSFFSKIKNILPWINIRRKQLLSHIDRHPLTSFFIALVLLLLVIIVASAINKPKETPKEQQSPKQVSVYTIGQTPKVTMQAKVEKTGVITIAALNGGVVSSVNVAEGTNVYPGTNLLQLSSNYQGGNAPAIQSQIAQTQYNNVVDTYQTQIDLINKQRETADKNRDNTEQQRHIAEQSRNDTQSLVDLNNTIMQTIDQDLSQYIATNSAGSNDQTIFQTRQLKSQYESALLQLNSSLRSLQYQTDTNQDPTKLADLQRDITKQQLDLQEKALNLSKEVSLLQLRLAQVNEGTMHPVSPVSGVVQRVFVRVGQSVAPGTPLFTIAGNTGAVKATVFMPQQMAQNVSLFEPSLLHLNGTTIEAKPFFVSTEAVQGNLYAAYFVIPQNYASHVSEGAYLSVDMPIGAANTGSAIPFIPLDSIIQTQDSAYVFVAKMGKAESKTIQLGNVIGRFAEIDNGLSSGDQIILDRTIVAGDKVTIKQ